MEEKLFGYLQYEQQLLGEMIRLAERQQVALVKYQISELSEITSFQEALIKSIREAEEKRIMFLMGWLGIDMHDAAMLQLSEIEKKIADAEICSHIKSLRRELRQLIEKLHNLNITNRLLTNRARVNIKDIMGFITGGKSVFNVEV